ncbi:MAG: hypothetical protein Q8882_03745 [Bacillota bacterium]|nr:hypothetical protein [Bacillota bacterium]
MKIYFFKNGDTPLTFFGAKRQLNAPFEEKEQRYVTVVHLPFNTATLKKASSKKTKKLDARLFEYDGAIFSNAFFDKLPITAERMIRPTGENLFLKLCPNIAWEASVKYKIDPDKAQVTVMGAGADKEMLERLLSKFKNLYLSNVNDELSEELYYECGAALPVLSEKSAYESDIIIFTEKNEYKHFKGIKIGFDINGKGCIGNNNLRYYGGPIAELSSLQGRPLSIGEVESAVPGGTGIKISIK